MKSFYYVINYVSLVFLAMLIMRRVSQKDRKTLVKAVKALEKHRGKSLGFLKNKIVTFAPGMFPSKSPAWFQLRREFIDIELDGMMAVGILFTLMEEENCCDDCNELTEKAMYETIRSSSFYIGPCDVKPFADMKLGPASRAFEFLDTLLKTLKVVRCSVHSHMPDHAIKGALIGEVQFEFCDLTLWTRYTQS